MDTLIFFIVCCALFLGWELNGIRRGLNQVDHTLGTLYGIKSTLEQIENHLDKSFMGSSNRDVDEDNE